MKQNQKLELTWIGKGDEPKLEPRILIEQPEYSYGDPNSGNILIHGDNLLALKALEQEYSGKIKCIYIDPPYNTGSAFEHYDDNVEHSEWLRLMSPRLKLLRNLLRNDGSIWISIDDDECHYLKVLCDEIFGRGNFITTICVKMSHLSGVKMSHKEKKPPKIKEYVLVYSKDKEMFSIKPAFEIVAWSESLERYNQFIINKERPFSEWKVKPIRQIAVERGINVKDSKEYEEFLLRNANSIFRTARNRSFTKVGIRNIFTQIKSKTGLVKLIYNDEEVLFASEKMTKLDGKLVPANPLGDIWLDIGINNLHNEGGVDFRNGKKPEKLIWRIIEITTNAGDIVLDSFVGSGSTSAVAHKMGRKWIGIELGEHAKTHCYPRLRKVIEGEQGGISKSVNWKGGGGFRFYTLAPSLLNKDKYGNWVISKEYNPDMLAAAMAKQEGFKYEPDEYIYWKQGKSSEKDFIFTTTRFITIEILDNIHDEMQPGESLLIACKAFQPECEYKFPSLITLKKIPQLLIGKCEFGKDDYSLNIVNLPGEYDKVIINEAITEYKLTEEIDNKEDDFPTNLFDQ